MPTILICNKRSTTLFEVIVAVVIFSLVMAGMVSVFVAGKRQIMHSQGRMTASEMGKLFLDPLQLAVRQNNWDASDNGLKWDPANLDADNNYLTYCDSVPGHATLQNPACPAAGERKVNNIVYTAEYKTAQVSGTYLRSAQVKVVWNEN